LSDAKHDFNQAGILGTQPPGFSTGKVLEIAKTLYGLAGSISPLDSERDQNFLIFSQAGDQFVIKISNSAMDPAVLKMQAEALEHIAKVDPELFQPGRGSVRHKNFEQRDGTSRT